MATGDASNQADPSGLRFPEGPMAMPMARSSWSRSSAKRSRASTPRRQSARDRRAGRRADGAAWARRQDLRHQKRRLQVDGATGKTFPSRRGTTTRAAASRSWIGDGQVRNAVRTLRRPALRGPNAWSSTARVGSVHRPSARRASAIPTRRRLTTLGDGSRTRRRSSPSSGPMGSGCRPTPGRSTWWRRDGPVLVVPLAGPAASSPRTGRIAARRQGRRGLGG